jgi:ABC-type proline/glycine betaine transport system substrate-binding protein
MLEDPLGVFASDTIQYAVYDAFAEANPDIMAFLDSFLIPMADIESMMAENENNNVPAEDLGVQWYQDHKSEVESWWP